MPGNRKKPLHLGLFFLFFLYRFAAFSQQTNSYLTFTADPAKDEIRFYLKDEKGNYFRSLRTLKDRLKANRKTLKFAMNGGMYQVDNRPLGLFIENGKTITKLNTRSGKGNFYLQPNGVFYLTANKKSRHQSDKGFQYSKRNVRHSIWTDAGNRRKN